MLARVSLIAVVGWLTVFEAMPETALAEDVFYLVPVSQLQFPDGEIPDIAAANGNQSINLNSSNWPAVVVLDSEGEGYLQQHSLLDNFGGRAEDRRQLAVVVRVPERREVTGRLLLPKPDLTGQRAFKFSIPAERGGPDTGRDFLFGKFEHYERLALRGRPGTAWFRHQAATARKALGALNQVETDRFTRLTAQRQNARRGVNGDNQTYELFSGGRAISENLQLDRELQTPQFNAKDEQLVPLSEIAGITIKEIDWKPLLKEPKPELDPLSSLIPADQYAIFFPSFAAAVQVRDEAMIRGTALLKRIEPPSQDQHLIERYEQQLGMSLDGLGRLLGAKFVSRLAITGSDEDFIGGTDVAVLFETPNPGVLAQLLLAKLQLEGSLQTDAKPVAGTIDGLKYQGLRSADRRICSYVIELPNAVAVTNSPAQLQRLADVQAKRAAAIASLDEYAFFRQRYQLKDKAESVLLFISDATIRRWCGPKWRIAKSRRLRDAAIMSRLQAEQLDGLVTGKDLKVGPLATDWVTTEPAQLLVTANGIESPQLGRLDFMTPISEMSFDKVTRAELQAYRGWRDGYQANWTGGFDPIALRVGLDQQRVSADLSVMPLIAQTRYRWWLQLVSGVKLPEKVDDPHDTIMHYVMALNRKSEPIQQANRWMASMQVGQRPGLADAEKLVEPLSWLGESIAVYADRDPYWGELANLSPTERNQRVMADGYRLPIGVQIKVKDSLKLALFLAGVRAWIEQTAPGIVRWNTQTHREQSYVKVTSRSVPDVEKMGLCYASVGDSLVLTLNEDLLKRAIDRQLAREVQTPDAKTADAPKSESPQTWLGDSVAANFGQGASLVMGWLDGPRTINDSQRRSWANLTILNEWKRHYPDRDPIEIHRRFWGVELLCPGGGQYVWNEKDRTMESTLFGHPLAPKQPDKLAAQTPLFESLKFGLTFELGGLRSRVEVERAKP